MSRASASTALVCDWQLEGSESVECDPWSLDRGAAIQSPGQCPACGVWLQFTEASWRPRTFCASVGGTAAHVFTSLCTIHAWYASHVTPSACLRLT
eukprot:scaffold58608_cov34-Tisochrysis_lutea.AAC.2